jgi:LmbE family N-acetylglucosaminyl deacetylase
MYWRLTSLLLFIFASLPVVSAENPFGGAKHFDDYVNRGARILVVGAHPDDESLAGPLLAYACIEKGNKCHIAIFTTGGGGSCGLFLKGCKPDLATVRTQEMEKVAKLYGVSLDIGDFSNQPPKVTDEKRNLDAIRAAWEDEGDPLRWLREIIERFRPDVLITLDPDHGFTGHAEHQLASILVNEVLDPEHGTPPGPRHLSVFHLINRYRILKPLLGNDPAMPTEQWDLSHMCGEQTCARMATEIAREHRSQLAVSSLALFVLFADKLETLYLRKLSAPEE